MKLLLRIVFAVILFFFIYNPPIRFLPMNAGFIVGGIFFILYLIQLLINLIRFKSVVFGKKVLIVALLLGCISAYSLLLAIVSGSGDIQVFKSYLSFLLFYLPGSFGIIKWMKKHLSNLQVIETFVLVTVLQSIIILIMLVDPAIKDFLFSILRDGSARVEKNLASGGFRFLGFAYNTTWDLSIVQSIGVMLIALLFKMDKRHVNIKHAFYFLILCVSVFLTARTGFLGIVFAFLIMLLPKNFREVPFSIALNFAGKVLLVLIPLFFLIKTFIPANVFDIVETSVLPWAFEMFQNDSGGKMETASSNELKSMYFEPSLKTLIIGDGFYVNPYDNTRYYMDTDAGYMRHVLFYGILGSLMMVSIYLIIFYQMFAFAGYSDYPSSFKVFTLFLCIYYFLSHVKGDLLMGSDIPIKALLILYALFYTFRDEATSLNNR